MKTKLQEWKEFAGKVENHITNYCVPQYGDYPDEEIEEWTTDIVRLILRKYTHRIGIDLRGSVEARRDALKIAHYACYLLKKLEEVSHV